jgi:hypothetical protein
LFLVELLQQRALMERGEKLPFDVIELKQSVTVQKDNFKMCKRLTQEFVPPFMVEMLEHGLKGLVGYEKVLNELIRANKVLLETDSKNHIGKLQ